MTKSYQQINSETVDRWVEDGWEWGIPVTREMFRAAQNGEWSVLLTPTKSVPADWFPDLNGLDLLGLASGGGQQMPLFCAAGARCTVLDYSEKQLESERMVAKREGYEIDIVRADMTRPLPFADESFDVIFHPVSNCYIREVEPVWKECFRVLRPGGVLMAGLDNGLSFLFDDNGTELKYALPFDPVANPELQKMLNETDSGMQFSHTLDEQIRGQIQAGFVIRDLYEDYDPEGPLAKFHVPTFWATLAAKA